MKLTVLSENYTPFTLGLRAEHGFSVLIENEGRHFLYDTGQFGICVDNARALKCDLAKIEEVILSHGHLDHTGGLDIALRAIGHPVVIRGHELIFEKKYAVRDDNLQAFGRKDVFIGLPFARAYLEKFLNARFALRNDFHEFAPGMWLTGAAPFSNDFEKIPAAFQVERAGRLVQDDFADDNSLVLETEGGLVVLLGCAHRGTVNILSCIRKKLNRNIRAVIGGTHLHGADPRQVEAVRDCLRTIFREDKTELFAPAHCTGFETIAALVAEFKSITRPAFCGSVFEFQ